MDSSWLAKSAAEPCSASLQGIRDIVREYESAAHLHAAASMAGAQPLASKACGASCRGKALRHSRSRD